MSLRSLLRSVVEWICPPRRVEPELRITPDQLRAALSEMLADPQTRRLVLRDFVGTVFPIAGGQSCTLAKFIQGATGDDGTFGKGSGCGPRIFTFEADTGSALALTVQGSSTDAVLTLKNTATGGASWDIVSTANGSSAGAGKFSIAKTGVAHYFTIDGSGNVGIGTTSPGSILEVSVNGLEHARFTRPSGGNLYVRFGNPGTTADANGIVAWDDTLKQLQLFVSGEAAGAALNIANGGNVGIGRTDRLSRVTVRGRASFTASGTVSTTAGSPTVTGSGSAKFLTEVGVGDRVTIGSETRIVTRIASDTSLTVQAEFANTYSGVSMTVLPSLFRTDGADGKVQVAVTDQGHLAFLSDNGMDPNGGGATEMWREGEADNSVAPDNIILQTHRLKPSPSTLLVIKAPEPTLPETTDREATLVLGRDLSAGGAEFLDFYNNFYTNEKQYGIRIQKRVAGEYRDFVIDRAPDGNTRLLMMVIRSSGKIGIGIRNNLTAKLTIKPDSPTTGTVNVSGSTVTGTATVFLQEVDVGDKIRIQTDQGFETRKVTLISSETQLTVDSAFAGSATGAAMTVITNSLRLDDSSGSVKVLVNDLGNVGIGTTDPKTALHGTGSTILGAPSTQQPSADLGNNQVNIWVDETLGSEKLMFKVKLSSGTVKSGSVPLSSS